MSFPVRIGIKHTGQDCTTDELKAVWRNADQAGFDHLWAFDHLATIGEGGPDRPIFEGWTLLGAMATATSHVRIGLNVTGNTYRNPALLAKIATTVDHLSDGRLEFGIGAAWAEIEHRMYGIAGLDHRVGRLSESLQIFQGLWTRERLTFEGRYYTMLDAIHNPKPVQKPYPPIWIGAGGEIMLKLVARHADVWNPTGPRAESRQGIQEMWAEIVGHCERIGRDPATIRRAANLRARGLPPEQVVERVASLIEIGMTEFMVGVYGPTAPRQVEVLAEKALPRVRALTPPRVGT
jgi:probable F420-dependent oxidoreductase